MKLFIALMTLVTISFAQAETGSVETLFTPVDAKEVKDASYPPPYPGPYASRLFLQNNCYTDALVAIRYINPRGQWESRGYFRVYPGQVVYATDFRENYYHLYAYTSDRRIFWQGGYNVDMLGTIVPSMLISVGLPPQGGDWTTVLYCR